MTFISDTARVRRLARNVVTADFTDAQIRAEQEAAYSDIFVATQIPWGDEDADPNAPSVNPTYTDDPRLPSVKRRETERAAAYVLEHYGSGSPEEINWIRFWVSEFDKGMASINEGGVDTELDAEINIATSDAESYPYALVDDSSAVPYRSTSEVL